MIPRIDRIPIELPPVTNPSLNSAVAVQELAGRRFGEMSTLKNWTMQSFNAWERGALRLSCDLTANIATDEYSHIELVSCTLHLLLTGAAPDRRRPGAWRCWGCARAG